MMRKTHTLECTRYVKCMMYNVHCTLIHYTVSTVCSNYFHHTCKFTVYFVNVQVFTTYILHCMLEFVQVV